MLVTVNGIGAIFGPLIASTLINAFSPNAYWWTLAGAHVPILAYVLYRILVKDAVPVDEQSTYQPFHARSSPLASTIGRIRPTRKKKSKKP